MPQYDFQIADYERIFRKRYRIVILSIILAVGFSIMFTKMKVPMYRASSTVKVDRNTVMGLGMEGVMYGYWDNIETQTKVITSFPVLVRAAKKLSLLSDTIPEDMFASDQKVMSTLENLRSQVTTSISSGTNIITITATSSKPEMAMNVANAMAVSYKEFSLHGKKLHAMKTKEFIQEQLMRCRSELSEAEDAVETFSESQKIPSITANASRIINDASNIDKELKTVETAISIVEVQQKKLLDRYNNKTDRLDLDSLTTDSATFGEKMSWISRFTDSDPGLTSLNNRLIGLQVEQDDNLAFYKKDHPTTKVIEKKIVETIEQILEAYKKKLEELDETRKDLLEKKSNIEFEMQQLPSNEMHYARLMRKLKVKEELNAMFSKKLEEALIAEAGIVDDIAIMSMASKPHTPINKNMSRMAGMGIFLGLIFGIIFAIIREMFDTSIGTIEDVERALKITVLAVIPHIHVDEQKNATKVKKEGQRSSTLRSILVTHFNSKDPTAETYRILRTNIEYISFEKPCRTILLTSATMQEGKSTTIANLAIAFAQQGKKVLLLECNLRRPSLQRLFGTDKGPGTSDILIEKVKWQECVRTVTDLALGEFSMEEILSVPGLDNFHIINYGHRPPNPTELLSSNRMNDLLGELRDSFDIVLVDAPPLLPVADSMVISTKVDGVILVYMVGKAPRNSLRLAKERLESVQANILGLVLNDIRPETSGLTYSSYYMYSYTATKDKKDKKRKLKMPGIISRIL